MGKVVSLLVENRAGVLARVVGLSRAEIAKKMGKTDGAVRTLLYRGLTALSDLLVEDT